MVWYGNKTIKFNSIDHNKRCRLDFEILLPPYFEPWLHAWWPERLSDEIIMLQLRPTPMPPPPLSVMMMVTWTIESFLSLSIVTERKKRFPAYPCRPRKDSFFRRVILTFLSSYVDKLEVKEGGVPGVGTALRFPSNLACKSY